MQVLRREDLRDAGVLARTELRAMARRIAANRRRLAGVGLGFLQFAVVFPLLFWGPITDFGARLASGDPPLGTLGAVFSALLVSGLYMGSMSSINQNRIGSVGPLVRTSIPPAAVAAGRIASELVQATVLFFPSILTATVLLGVGAGGPLAPLLAFLGFATCLLAGMFVGRTIGGVTRYAGLLARLSTWTKVLAFVVVMALIFLGSQVAMQAFLPDDADFGFSVGVPAFLPGEPVQAFAAVVCWPLGATPGPLGLFVSLCLLALIPLGIAAAVETEAAVLLSESEGEAEESVVETRSIPRPFAAFPSGRMAFRHLLRTVRDPKSLAHLFPLLFGGLAAGASWITQPDLALTMGPPATVVAGAVLAGAAYCLNPMGDDRNQLPLIMTSTDSTAVLLRGRVVAGATLGLALGVGIGTPLAIVGHSPAFAIGQTLLSPVLAFASAGTALGLGGLVPKFERHEYMNVERAHPSQMALLGFFFGGSLVAGAGLFLLYVTTQGELPLLLAAGIWLGYLLVLCVLGAGGYVYAVRKFDALTMDDV